LIAQTDTRTVRSTQQPGCDSIHSSVAVIQREFMNTLAGGMGFEINVFGHGWIEQDKRMMQVLGKCRQIEESMRKVPRKILDKETSVAVIVDELSTYYTVQGAPQHGIAVNEQTKDLAHAGVGFDSFMIEDLEKIPDYTCYLFLNTFLLTDRQKAFIDQKLKRDNKTLVWLYAPGLIDGRRLNPAHIQQVTGIAMEIQERAVRPVVAITDTDDPVSRHMGKNSLFSYFSSREIGPLFIPREGRVLGVLQGTDTPALVVKRNADWTSVYSFCPRLPPSLIRGIAQSARVHIMSYENEDSCYISDSLLGVHTASGGERTFYPPKGTKKVRELFRDREYEVRDGSFAAALQPVSSYLFYMTR